MNGHRLSWLALVALLACVTRGVRADGPRVYFTAVPAVPTLDLEARKIAALARAALAESEGFQFLDADMIVRGNVSAAHEAYARALEGLKQGRQAYIELEHEQAVATLERAFASWLMAGAVVDNPEPVAETLMYLGASYVLAGNLQKADQAFARYHAAFADIVPDVQVFNPEIMVRWEHVGRKLREAGLGKLVVIAKSTSTAEVTIDGRVRGTGALAVEGLVQGEHWVRVSVPGASSLFKVVTVRPRQTTEIDATGLVPNAKLEQLLASAASDDTQRALLEELSVDVLGVLVVRGEPGGTLVLTLQNAGHIGTLSAEAGGGPGEKARAVRGLVATLLEQVAQAYPQRPSAVARDSSRLSGRENDSGAAKPLYKRPWFWVVVGGVAVAAAGGAALALDVF